MERKATRRRFLRAGGAASALALAGCLAESSPVGGNGGGSSGWRHYQGNAAHTGYTSESGPASSVGVDWKFDADSYVRTAPVVVDGTVYADDEDGVFALDAESGEVEWREDVEEERVDSLSVVDGRVYFHQYDRGAIALDASDGSEVWRNDDLGTDSAVTVLDGTVYVAEREGDLVALDAENGERQWAFETEDGVTRPPAVADGSAYFVTAEDEDGDSLIAVDVESGDKELRSERKSTVLHCPTVADGSVYLQNIGVDSVLASGGERDWRNDDNVVVARTSVAAGDVYENAFAIDAETGETEWERKLDDRVKTSPVVADGTMYVVTLSGTAYALDAESGEVLWEQSVDAEVYESLAVADGRLYVPSRDGALYALAEQ